MHFILVSNGIIPVTNSIIRKTYELRFTGKYLPMRIRNTKDGNNKVSSFYKRQKMD